MTIGIWMQTTLMISQFIYIVLNASTDKLKFCKHNYIATDNKLCITIITYYNYLNTYLLNILSFNFIMVMYLFINKV